MNNTTLLQEGVETALECESDNHILALEYLRLGNRSVQASRKPEPLTLYTLLDMITFLPTTVYATGSRIGSLLCELSTELKAANYRFASEVPKKLMADWEKILTWIRELADTIEMGQTRGRLRRIDNKDFPFDIIGLQAELREMELSIMSDLGGYHFLALSGDGATYYDKGDLFGIAESFPGANKDVISAGNCYATANYSASVFHLMRVVESGAKSLVKAMKAEKYILVPTQEKGKTLMVKKPIELCDWKMLKDGLTKSLNQFEQGTKISLKKKQDLEYFSHAVSQFSLFKDAWRNKTAHSRHVYGAGEAKDIMENVRQFMVHLAKRVKE